MQKIDLLKTRKGVVSFKRDTNIGEYNFSKTVNYIVEILGFGFQGGFYGDSHGSLWIQEGNIEAAVIVSFIFMDGLTLSIELSTIILKLEN